MEAEVGMRVVETISKTRRAYFAQGLGIKAICRELGVSRKAVRKVIRSGASEFHYERGAQPLPKIGPWRDKLNQLLASNEGKAAREPLTLIRLYEELKEQGYGGGYDAVRRYAARWRKSRGQATAEAYVPLSFAPGEAFQFDWSHEVVVLDGATVTIKVAHVRLCHSRMLFVRAYPRETQEMVFDAHEKGFAFFKGTCRRGIYDNMKTAVDAIFVGKQRQFNRRFAQMCGHYLFEPTACTPAAGWEKGQVENQVGLVRERFCRAARGDSGLRRSPRHPPGWRDRRRASPPIRAGEDDLRSLALRAGAGSKARRLEEWRAVQGLGAAGRARQGAEQARRRSQRRSPDGRFARRRADRRPGRRRGRLRRGARPGRLQQRRHPQHPDATESARAAAQHHDARRLAP
jgi:transposase